MIFIESMVYFFTFLFFIGLVGLSGIGIYLLVKNKNDDSCDFYFENLNNKLRRNAKGIDGEHKPEKKDFKNKLFVINLFDLEESWLDSISGVVSSIIEVAVPGDEVLLKINSPGGSVTGFGLVYQELKRFRKENIRVTAAVDEVAASGGYLIACSADRIIAAPFSIVGSIGVIASFPNFNKLLKSFNIDYHDVYSGDSKKGFTIMGEITDKDLKRFESELVDIHNVFKRHVKEARSQADIDGLATGKFWVSEDAINLGLIDEIKTSGEFISEKIDSFEVLEISQYSPSTFMDNILGKLESRIKNRLNSRFLPIK